MTKVGRPYGSINPYTEPKRPLHPIIYALRKRRIEANITQGDLSVETGFSIRTIADWERGLNQPNFRALCEWAHALGVNITLEFSTENGDAS